LVAKESEALEAQMQLQFAEQRVRSLESHVQELRARIAQLEGDLNETNEEKREILIKLNKTEADLDSLNTKVIEELKMQLKRETEKLAKVNILNINNIADLKNILSLNVNRKMIILSAYFLIMKV